MQRLEFSGAVRPIYVSLGVKRLISTDRRLIYSSALGLKCTFVTCDRCFRKYDLRHVTKHTYFPNFPNNLTPGRIGNLG